MNKENEGMMRIQKRSQ